MDKKSSRIRRARKTRAKISELAVPRLSVHRTPRHIYAQVIAASGSEVVVSASTVQADLKGKVKNTGNIDAATAVGKAIAEKAIALPTAVAVGKAIAEKALAAGVSSVAFDRSGFKYHGRVKALADAAREAGLKI